MCIFKQMVFGGTIASNYADIDLNNVLENLVYIW